MAELLRQVIAAGAPPSMARLPMTPEEVAASYDDQETGTADHVPDVDEAENDTGLALTAAIPPMATVSRRVRRNHQGDP
jgi:hypothetical protein